MGDPLGGIHEVRQDRQVDQEALRIEEAGYESFGERGGRGIRIQRDAFPADGGPDHPDRQIGEVGDAAPAQRLEQDR